MAYLKDNAVLRDVDAPYLSYFTPEEGRQLEKAYLVENGSLVLVEETFNGDIYYSFFDKETSRRIPTRERYDQEDGRVEKSELELGYACQYETFVDPKTGFETVSARLFEEGRLVHSEQRFRYVEGHQESLLESYLGAQAFKKQQEVAKDNYLKTFFEADFDSKVRILNRDFRNVWKEPSVNSSEIAEYFLSTGQFHDLDNDKDFRRALLTCLGMQKAYTDIPAQLMYDRILERCIQTSGS